MLSSIIGLIALITIIISLYDLYDAYSSTSSSYSTSTGYSYTDTSLIWVMIAYIIYIVLDIANFIICFMMDKSLKLSNNKALLKYLSF